MSFALLNTTELNDALEKMFKKERHFILIVSPYIDFTARIKTILSESPAKVVVLYRDPECNGENAAQKSRKTQKIDDLKREMPKTQFLHIKNLHAKAYVTSGTLIITSLNLYEHSQNSNFELGIVLKDTAYNLLIGKLAEDLKYLFAENKHDKGILGGLRLPVINDLYKDILARSKKSEKDFHGARMSYLTEFSKQMAARYNFDRKDFWTGNEHILCGTTAINRPMYEWALENIRL
jgi:phosphatidylserine/phosphatidylglycerophosphate/cardiolipin synthase-like enzyme